MSRDEDTRLDGRPRAGQDRRSGPGATVPGLGQFEAAGLFGRFLRGDRSVTGELYARLTALRA